MAAFIKINGREYPCPRRGLNLMTATIVDSARNANAVVVGQVVGIPDGGTVVEHLEGVQKLLCDGHLPGHGEQHLDYPENVPG